MMLDYLCNPRLPLPPDSRNAQIITGLEIPQMLNSNINGNHPGCANARDWARWVMRPLFRNFTGMDGVDASKTGSVYSSEGNGIDYQAAFTEANTSLTASAHVVSLSVKGKLACTLQVPEEGIETQKSIHTYGVDSLLAM